MHADAPLIVFPRIGSIRTGPLYPEPSFPADWPTAKPDKDAGGDPKDLTRDIARWAVRERALERFQRLGHVTISVVMQERDQVVAWRQRRAMINAAEQQRQKDELVRLEQAGVAAEAARVDWSPGYIRDMATLNLEILGGCLRAATGLGVEDEKGQVTDLVSITDASELARALEGMEMLGDAADRALELQALTSRQVER